MADGLLAGQEFANTLQETSRKTAAYNALRNVYGDVAGNPQAAGELQQQSQSAQLFPGQLAQQGANLAQTQAGTAQTAQTTALAAAQAQREGQFRALTMLENNVNPQTGSIDAATFDRVVNPQTAQMLGIDPAHVQPLRDALTSPGGAQHIDTIKRGLIAPTAATGQPIVAQDASGNSVLINRDKYGNPIQQQLPAGVTPVSQQTANLGKARLAEKTVQDKLLDDLSAGRLSVAQYRAKLEAANKANLPDVNPPGSAPPAAVPGTAPGAPAAPPQSQFDRLPMGSKARDVAIGSAQSLTTQKINLDNANFIADSMEKQIGPYSTGAGGFLKRIPAGLAKDLEANATSMSSMAAAAVMQGMKNAQGQTGIGRVLQSEYKNFTTQLGNLADQEQSDTQYLQHLHLARQALNNLFDAQRNGFKQRYGKEYHEVIPQPQAGSAAGAPPAQAGNADDAALLAKYGVK